MTNSPTFKLFDSFIITGFLIFNSLVANVDWPFVVVAIGGSVSGSIVLGYFRRDKRRIEQFLRSACAAISGIVIGTVVDELLALGNAKLSLGIFFASGFVSLAILRATLQITERHTLEVMRDVLLRLLGLPPRNGNNNGGN